MAQTDMAGVYLQFVIQQITSRGRSIHEKNLMIELSWVGLG